MHTLGCDVSHWEGIVDWQQAARWIPYVYFKCTDGVADFDHTFIQNKLGCEKNGIPHAPYHYFQPEQDPTTQADWFINNAGRLYHRYIVDVEEQPHNLPDFTVALRTFILRIKQLTGVQPAIYTSPGFWDEFAKPRPAWTRTNDLIVAHYTSEHAPQLPIGWDQWILWQYTDYFYFPGCSSAADGDWFNGNLGEARAWFGNFKEIEPPFVSATRLRSNFDQLHVRLYPNTISKEVDHLAKGEIVELIELGGKDVWLRHARGWTCVEKEGYRYMEVLK